MGIRRNTRLYSLQELYRAQASDVLLDEVLTDARKEVNVYVSDTIVLSDIDNDFFETLISKTMNNLAEIDALIAKNIQQTWSMERLNPVMKNLLRIAIAEIIYFKEIPSNIIFNEYIEIGKSFFETNDVSFLNGILNKIEKEVRVQQPGLVSN